MQLTPYSELLALTAEQRDQKAATTKIAHQKQRGLLRLSELEVRLASLEDSITKACQEIELDFDRIADKLDEHALTLRRKEQLTSIINQLFPA